MIRRLEHWLDMLPAVEGASIRLLDPSQARQLCTTADVPAANCLQSPADDLRRSISVEADSDAQCLDAEKSSEASALQVDCGESLQPPDFPLLPVSRGFHMKLQKLLAQFETTLTAAGITTSRSGSPS